jgi:hypothetical protein
MTHTLFVILVVLGFILRLCASLGVSYADRAAWVCWTIASVLWAAGQT